LVVLQIALSVVLVVGAALMTRSFIELQRVDPGFRSDRMLTFRIALPGRYARPQGVNDFDRRLHTELAALPGVTGVGSVSHVPYDNLPNWGGPYIRQPGEDDSVAPMADNRRGFSRPLARVSSRGGSSAGMTISGRSRW
jgi:hypothetical protein